MAAPAPTRRTLALALGAAIVSISSAALLIRSSHSGPVTLSFYRLAYATAALAPFAWHRARSEWAAFTRRDAALVTASGVMLALHFATWISSLAPASSFATTVAASTVIVTLHPVLVAVGTPWILNERVPSGVWIGLVAALAGGCIIAAADARHGTHRLVGDALAFAGACAAAAYFLIGRRMRARWSLLAYVTPVYAVAAISLGLIAWLAGESIPVVEVREHALFLALAVGPMLLGHTVINWVLGHASAWIVSTSVLAEPVGSTLLVWAVLGERPALWTVVGGAVVLSGVGFVTLRARQSV